MSGTETLEPFVSRDTIQTKGMSYFQQGGLLLVGNLLKAESWVDDALRSHCSVCFQQFLPFRRRHHCRTCGEVVCSACSSQRPIRLTDINVECETRVCTLCIVQARGASVNPHSLLGCSSPSSRQDNQLSVSSGCSEPTAVPLRSARSPTNEIRQLELAKKLTIGSADIDPTLHLLVAMVARALECPIALIGIMEDASFRIKASCGLDTRVTSIPRNECVCVHTLTQNMTTVVDDTRLDQYFQAKVYDAGRKSMRYYAGTPVCIGNHGVGVLCALDTKSHTRTTNEMKLILEAVADIVAEVLEQRLASGGTMKPPMEMKDSIGVAFQRGMISQNASLHSLDLLFVSQRKLFSSDEATSYDSRHSSMSSYLSQQDADKIAQVMVFFKQLQRSMWCEQRIGSKRSCNGAIRLFELVYDAKVFTRSIMKMAGSCSTVIAELLNYETSSLYPEFFTRASSRYDLDDATFLDIVSVHTSINSTSARILTHQRKYPDGSNVVVAMKGDNDTPETNESGFLFGWYVAPSRQDGDVTSLVKVSCITAEVHHDASRGQNLSLDLLRRMYRKMSMARVVVQSNETETFSVDPSEEPSSAQTESLISEKNKTLLRSSNKMHLETQSIDPTETSRETNHMTRGTLHDTVAQVSQVNEMEQLLMAFLDKTIGTQALLVQQHHEMVSIMDVHGNQLQRISSALRRMESILSATERRRAC